MLLSAHGRKERQTWRATLNLPLHATTVVVDRRSRLVCSGGPGLAAPRAFEPDPDGVDGGGDDSLARHVGMLAPPDREPGEPCAHHLGRHLEGLLVSRAGNVLRAR